MKSKTLKLAITCNIASGKSHVLKRLAKRYKIADSDSIVNSLYKKSFFKKMLKKKFGTFYKKKIAELIFKDKAKRKKLEIIVWPLVRKNLEEFFARNKAKKAIIVEVQLLYEARMQDLFDLVIFIDCKKNNQLRRLLKLGFSRKEALARINAQMPSFEKSKKADIVIENNGSLKQLNKKIESLINILERICFLVGY